MKPILFSTKMVQAVLDGRKTVTRRLVRPQPAGGIRHSVFVKSGVEDGRGREVKPPCLPGDILYVRETWRLVDFEHIDGEWSASVQFKDETRGTRLRFGQEGADQKLGWRPSIHMPREAARLFLRVTDVRIEKLQEITEEQAMREGFSPIMHNQTNAVAVPAQKCFHAEWDSIYATKGYWWEKNPWVFVIEFDKVGGA